MRCAKSPSPKNRQRDGWESSLIPACDQPLSLKMEKTPETSGANRRPGKIFRKKLALARPAATLVATKIYVPRPRRKSTHDDARPWFFSHKLAKLNTPSV
jgi:hypothetical protein